MLPGYAGRILYIDINTGNVVKELLDTGLVRTYLGGAGSNNKLAYDLIAPDVDPLSTENAIIIGTGPFHGTPEGQRANATSPVSATSEGQFHTHSDNGQWSASRRCITQAHSRG